MIKHLMGNYIVTLFGKQWQNYHMKFACRDCDILFYALTVFLISHLKLYHLCFHYSFVWSVTQLSFVTYMFAR